MLQEPAKLTRTEPTRVLDNALLDFGMESLHALIIKGNFSADQNIQNNTETPNVNLRACIRLGLQQFWCRKVKTAAERLQVRFWCKQVAQAEIDYFYITSLAYENVLDL